MIEENVKKEFSLGPGRLYIAGGRVPENKLEESGIKAGETEGGCVLRYDYKTKELCDVDGNVAAILSFGEKVRVSGKLCRISSEAMPLIVSGDKAVGGRGTLSVLLVCPLPDGDSFRLYVRGGVPAGTVFNVTDSGGLEFELTCGGDLSHPRFCFRDEAIPLSGRRYA